MKKKMYFEDFKIGDRVCCVLFEGDTPDYGTVVGLRDCKPDTTTVDVHYDRCKSPIGTSQGSPTNIQHLTIIS